MIFLDSKFVAISLWVFDIVVIANDIVNSSIAPISTIGKVIDHVPQEPSKKSNVDLFDDNLCNELFNKEAWNPFMIIYHWELLMLILCLVMVLVI
jgi:hypothetical protein